MQRKNVRSAKRATAPLSRPATLLSLFLQGRIRPSTGASIRRATNSLRRRKGTIRRFNSPLTSRRLLAGLLRIIQPTMALVPALRSRLTSLSNKHHTSRHHQESHSLNFTKTGAIIAEMTIWSKDRGDE